MLVSARRRWKLKTCIFLVFVAVVVSLPETIYAQTSESSTAIEKKIGYKKAQKASSSDIGTTTAQDSTSKSEVRAEAEAKDSTKGKKAKKQKSNETEAR